MAAFARLLAGLCLLPACWGLSRAAVDCLRVAAGRAGGFNAEVLALLAGVVAFVALWLFASHPVKAYVLGHELTHALWGLLFGARPSRLKVSESGGSVNLTKTNLLITLAPYFFPFYTFVVVVAAGVTALFVRPLPFLPGWLFLVGLTWSFHALFTIETLCRRQPDVTLYGRVFSWAVVFMCNVLLMLVALAAATSLTFAQLGGFLAVRVTAAYVAVGTASVAAIRRILSSCFPT